MHIIHVRVNIDMLDFATYAPFFTRLDKFSAWHQSTLAGGERA